MELSVQQQINGLRLQNSCIRLQLKKVKERYSHFEKSNNEAPSDNTDDITDQDISACIKVLKYLDKHEDEIETYKFSGVTKAVEGAYRSRIIKALMSKKGNIKYKKKTYHHIAFALDDEKKRNCLMRARKGARQVIPTSSQLIAAEDSSSVALGEAAIVEEGDSQHGGGLASDGMEATEAEVGGETTSKDDTVTGGRVILENMTQEDIHKKKLASDDKLYSNRVCYVCHKPFNILHFFYGCLCPPCAELNYSKRIQDADLTGKIAIVTGGRIKVGYTSALTLLRCGATVVVTTRFPRHALINFSRENDFYQWRDRLKLYGPLDFGDTRNVENFVEYIKSNFNELHIIINNAAQTVSRPPEYYDALRRLESTPLSEYARKVLCILPPTTVDEQCTEVQQSEVMEASAISWEGEVLDLRATNSWTSQIDGISTAELMEVQAVNVIAPFVLCSKLKGLMAQTQGMKFIVNVSAVEGQFYRVHKDVTHPHTTLNMMTRTSAPDFAQYSIYLNSVDPGWVSHMGPSNTFFRGNHGLEFEPPLDAIDGAARVCDPIFQAIKGNAPLYGLFLKDYTGTCW